MCLFCLSPAVCLSKCSRSHDSSNAYELYTDSLQLPGMQSPSAQPVHNRSVSDISHDITGPCLLTRKQKQPACFTLTYVILVIRMERRNVMYCVSPNYKPSIFVNMGRGLMMIHIERVFVASPPKDLS